MLLLSFALDLENFDVDELIRPNGPLFHRWLPDGKTDALRVRTSDRRNRLILWFERKGRDERLIRYDHERCEVKEEIMRRQGKLDAGPLRGEAFFVNATKSEINALRDNRQGSDEYVGLAKRIVDFLYLPL